MPRRCKLASPFRYFNSFPEVIRPVVIMFVRFRLSYAQAKGPPSSRYDYLAEQASSASGVSVDKSASIFGWNTTGSVNHFMTAFAVLAP